MMAERSHGGGMARTPSHESSSALLTLDPLDNDADLDVDDAGASTNSTSVRIDFDEVSAWPSQTPHSSFVHTIARIYAHDFL